MTQFIHAPVAAPLPSTVAAPTVELPDDAPKALGKVYAEYLDHVTTAERLADERRRLWSDVAGNPGEYDVARAGEALRAGEDPPRPVTVQLAELDEQIAVHTAAGNQARAELLEQVRAVADEELDRAHARRTDAHTRWVTAVDDLADAHAELATSNAKVRFWHALAHGDPNYSYAFESAPFALAGVDTYGGATRARELFDDLRHAADWVRTDELRDAKTGASQ
jgi:hypothetical protein